MRRSSVPVLKPTMRASLPGTIGTVLIQRSTTFLQLQRCGPRTGPNLVGEMAPYTAGAGRLYFPGGTPDPSAIDDRGEFDPIDHLSRELREETGIRIDELDAEPGWILVRDRCSMALIRRLISRENADHLRHRIMRHLRDEQQPELRDIHFVRGPTQLDAPTPTYVTALLQEEWRQGTAKM